MQPIVQPIFCQPEEYSKSRYLSVGLIFKVQDMAKCCVQHTKELGAYHDLVKYKYLFLNMKLLLLFLNKIFVVYSKWVNFDWRETFFLLSYIIIVFYFKFLILGFRLWVIIYFNHRRTDYRIRLKHNVNNGV